MVKFNITLFHWLISILVPLAFLVLIEMTISTKQNEIAQEVERKAYEYGESIISHINQELNPLVYLSKGIEAYIKVSPQNEDSTEISALLKQISEDSQIIKHIVIAKGTVLKYIEPMKGNESILGVDYKTVPAQWPLIKEIIRTGKDVLTGSVDLIQGGTALIYRKPIYQKKQFWGILSIVIDVNKLFEVAFKDLPSSNYSFSIRLYSDNPSSNILYGNENVFNNTESIIIKDSIPDGKWEYAVLATSYPSEYKSLTIVRWAARSIISIVIIILIFFINLNKKVKKNEANYKLLAHNLSNIIWIFNLEKRRIVFITPSVYEYLGYSVHETTDSAYVNNSLILGFDTIKNNEIIEQLKSFISGKTTTKKLVLEYQVKHKEGEILWVQTEFKLLKNKKKQVIELLGNTQVIHNRKIVEIQLRESESRLRAIVNTTLIGVSIIDSEGFFQFTNSNSQKIHAYSSDELQSKSFCEILHAEDIGKFNENLKKLISKEIEFIDLEIRVLHKITHDVIWIHISATIYSKIVNQNNENILILYQDITNLKNFEKELKDINTTKDQFISVLAHDLKSPFNGILGFLSYLIDNFESLDKDTIKDLIRTLHTTSKNTYLLLENLLLWARTQQQKVSFQPEEIRIKTLVDNNIDLLIFSAQSKQITIHNHIADDILVCADIEMLNTIFRNLISNAIKFTKNSGMITIKLIDKPNFFEFIVQDNGIGMSKEMTTNLFNFNTTKTKTGTNGEIGTGFGLIICKDFITLHGGEIWVESEENLGTSFHFNIAKQKLKENTEKRLND